MLAFNFLNELEKELDKKKIKRKELAKMVGTSPSYITQLFRGTTLPNLNILTAMGLAVGKQFDVRAVASIEDSRRDYAELEFGNHYNVNDLIKKECKVVPFNEHLKEYKYCLNE